MNADAKLELINTIAKSENSLLLEEIRKLVGLSPDDQTYMLSDEQLKAIEVADKDIQHGSTMTNAQTKEATRKWFEK